ncbi:MAG: ParB/RepB/Spo0J family partition protein, partial [Candidatus Methylomirabilia bacterium]
MATPKYRPIPIAEIQEPPTPLRGQIGPGGLRELMDSLSTHGLLQPILIRHTGFNYTIIAGHRRFLAAKALGWQTIDANVTTATDDLWSELALIENVQREDLTPVEEARVVYALVKDDEADVDVVARRFGKSRAWVDARLQLLEYPEDLLAAIHAGQISLAVAKELARVAANGYRGYLLESAVNNGCTAQVARMWATEWEKSNPDPDQRVTASTGPTPPYEGQAVGIGCAGCRRLHPVAELRPIYFCSPCLQD